MISLHAFSLRSDQVRYEDSVLYRFIPGLHKGHSTTNYGLLRVQNVSTRPKKIRSVLTQALTIIQYVDIIVFKFFRSNQGLQEALLWT